LPILEDKEIMTNEDSSLRPFTAPATGALGDRLSARQPAEPEEPTPPANGDVRPDRAVEAARTLTAMVQNIVHQIEEQEALRRELQERVRSLEDAARGYSVLRDQLREGFASGLTREDLQTLQRVLQDLAQDPNHIMVLASVAQQAGKLLTVVQGYARVQEALSR
jgi:hypothetical protein